jgi:quercetin dioxygenase-like cupin family protein
MRTIAWIACALAITIAPACASAMSGSVSAPVAQMRTTNTGQPIVVPAHPTVIVSQTTLAPGGRTPSHKHPYPHYVYVLEGTLTVVDEQSGRTFETRKDGFFAEMVDTWHHGENRGKTPVRILAIDQVPEGVTRNMVMKPGQ